jgi:type I restriction enzyme M protein
LKPCVDWWGGAKREGRAETELAWRVTADAIKDRGYNLDIKNPHSSIEGHADASELLRLLGVAEAQVAAACTELKESLAEALLR